MFCVQESDSLTDPFANGEQDPLTITAISESSDDEPKEPAAKRLKSSYTNSLNLKVYQIPEIFNTPKSLSIYPTPAHNLSNHNSNSLPKFVNNPLNLANPLSLATNFQNSFARSLQAANGRSPHANSIVKSLQNRYSLPSKLTITPVQSPNLKQPPPLITNSGEVIRYKKNGEVAKKRGPPKGYKRKPKELSQSFSASSAAQAATQALIQVNHQPLPLTEKAQNTILTSLLAARNMANLDRSSLHPYAVINAVPPGGIPIMPPRGLTIVPQVPQHVVPKGVEVVQLDLDPEDWFPSEPYKMSFSRKKNPKWKSFPHRCEHCFKGYRVVSTLLSHAAERHGTVPKELAIPCPCCPHVSTRRKQHKKHLETHEGRRHRIFCVYCIPPPDPTEPFIKESERYPFDKFPQYWYASEESLRLHKKRKHPYAAMFNYNWFCSWGENS